MPLQLRPGPHRPKGPRRDRQGAAEGRERGSGAASRSAPSTIRSRTATTMEEAGRSEPTRTPTLCSASTSPRAPSSPSTILITWSRCRCTQRPTPQDPRLEDARRSRGRVAVQLHVSRLLPAGSVSHGIVRVGEAQCQGGQRGQDDPSSRHFTAPLTSAGSGEYQVLLLDSF